MTGSTNGIELSSPDGATWVYVTDPVNGALLTGFITTEMYDGGFFAQPFSLDGAGADTIGLGGFALFEPGIPNGFDEVVAYIDIFIESSMGGLTFCVDSSFYQPSNSWTWSIGGGVGGQVPAVIGNGCWGIYHLPCKSIPPIIENCPTSLNFDHCQMATYDFDATDPLGDPLSFSIIQGPGIINVASGVWSYQPSLADVGTTQLLRVRCSNNCSISNSCSIDLTFTDLRPQFVGTCDENFVICDDGYPVQLTADAVDCDPNIFSIASISPPSTGISIDSLTGILITDTNLINNGVTYLVTVQVTDGIATSQCTINLTRSRCIVRGDLDGSGTIEIVDLTLYVDYLFRGGLIITCHSTKDFDGNGTVEITDLTSLVDYMFRGGPPPPDCS